MVLQSGMGPCEISLVHIIITIGDFFVSGGGLIKVGIPALNVGSIIDLMGFLAWDYRCAPGHLANGVLEIKPITLTSVTQMNDSLNCWEIQFLL